MFRSCKTQAIVGFILITFTFFITIIAVLGFSLWRANNRPVETRNINSDVVIDRIESQFFAVTRTVYSDQNLEIDIDRGSSWSNFWWGKSINAEARVRVDMGVDFKNLSTSDISVDDDKKEIIIITSGPEILNKSISDNLEIEVSGSMLTRIFARDYNKDYQLVSEELLDAAERAIVQDERLQQDAFIATEEALNYLFSDSGYQVKLEIRN